jgi:type II secretory pathway pseudopilin PulG
VKVRSKVTVAGKASGFTMIEIAISLAVIGFALVAIIGILPLGLNEQKDNREDTIASQDGQYFMDLLRFGRQGVNSTQGLGLDFLTNYVETIEVKSYAGTNFVYDNLISDITYGTLDAPEPVPGNLRVLTNGHVIVGMLSVPKYTSGGTISNDVVAIVRAMSGSATEQNAGAASQVAFRYQLDVSLMPYRTSPWFNGSYTNYPVGNSGLLAQTNLTIAQNQLRYWQNNLTDLRLQFSWPVLPSGSTGPNRKYFRTLVSGRLEPDKTLDLPVYYFNPSEYSSTNSAF